MILWGSDIVEVILLGDAVGMILCVGGGDIVYPPVTMAAIRDLLCGRGGGGGGVGNCCTL